MIIRQPQERDREAVREVKALAVVPLRKIYKPTQAALTRKASRAHIRKQIMCECEGRVVATVEYEVRPETLHVLGPMVHPDYQRRGIGRALLNHIAGVAGGMGKRALSLNTCKQTGNVAIFARLDFEVVRESADEYDLVENLTDEQLIDVYMERSIGQATCRGDA